MSNPIHLAGPYLWLWGVWHICWLAGFLTVAPLLGPDIAASWFVVLYCWFLPQEISGAILNRRRMDGRARTLSECRQWFATQAKPDRPGVADDLLSWRALAGGTGFIDAGVMGMIVGHFAMAWSEPFVGAFNAPVVGTAVGAAWGLTLALWLVPHFGWRGTFG